MSDKPTRTALFRIDILLDEFPVTVELNGSGADLVNTLARLRELGAVPPTPAAAESARAELARSVPVCKWHGPMKESVKAPGTYYCSAKMGDGSYCKEKA